MNLDNFNCNPIDVKCMGNNAICSTFTQMFVICIDNRQNQLFSQMSLRDVMELPIIKSLYLQQKATVRYENEPSEEISIKLGVRRGCILSPCLFNIYTEYLIREAGGWRGNKQHQYADLLHNHTGRE